MHTYLPVVWRKHSRWW